MRSFEIGPEDFLLDGKPHRVLSGAVHYFRVHPDQWAHRIAMARAMGLNTIETYVAWNAHAPDPCDFRLDGGLDLGRFLDLIAEAGMHAIVRPGPYICAEWNNGGLPAWLFRDGARMRSTDPEYLAAVDGYLERLAPVLRPRQIDRGGPIILMQLENEYGAFGSDTRYLAHLAETYRRLGFTVPFVTVDQPTDEMLTAGSLPGVHLTGSFGGNVGARLATLRRHQPTGPLMCMEFWIGWFDHWGEHHHTTSAPDAAKNLEDILDAGASVNIYMFHGGTNFGAMSGANDKGIYRAITTSYDYDAPLDEAGRPTEKFFAFRDVLARRFGAPPPLPAEPDRFATFEVPFDRFSALPSWTTDVPEVDGTPAPNACTASQPLLRYRTTLPRRDRAAVLTVAEVRDLATVIVDGTSVGTLARDHHDTRIVMPEGGEGVLEILVEGLGGVDYGPRIGEPKGLIGPITLDGHEITMWTLDLHRIDAAAVSELVASGVSSTPVGGGPALSVAHFDLSNGAVCDLALSTQGWGRGQAWINGFALGRFWSRGPQRTLYIPAPALQNKSNELIVLDMTGPLATAAFVDDLDLGPTEA
jgi:beta-galactosidase